MAHKDNLFIMDSNQNGRFQTPQGSGQSVSTGTIVDRLNTFKLEKSASNDALKNKRKAPEYQSDDLPVAKKKLNHPQQSRFTSELKK